MQNKTDNILGLRKKIEDVVVIFLLRDSKLLELGAHEQAISHQVAVYLEQQFKVEEKLNVDCEYSRHLEKAKRMDMELADLKEQKLELLACGCSACEDIPNKTDLDDKLFRPDIVVHSRGNDDRNMIVVEIKNTGKFCPFDGAKLKALTAPKTGDKTFEYQLGVFISFSKEGVSFKWYSNGDSLPE